MDNACEVSMKYDDAFLDRVHAKTNGKCHICRKTLARRNHGCVNKRGAWEVDHSVPRSRNGTDHLNNLLPACIECNRTKSDSSTTTARAAFGFSSTPFSAAIRQENAVTGGVIGLLVAAVVPLPIRIPAAILFAVLGAVLGHDMESD